MNALVILFLAACSQPNEESSNLSWSIKPGKELVLHLDSVTAPNENYFRYLKNFHGKETIAFHILGANMFKFYDLNTGKVHHEIKYPISGPSALNSVYGFYIHNPDSIFLSQQYHYRLLLLNSKFEKIDELDLAPENVEFKVSSHVPKKGNFIQTASISSRAPLTVRSGKVIIPSMNMSRADEKSYTRDGHLFTVFDLESRAFAYKLKYPEDMQDKFWGGMLTFTYTCYNPKTNKIITSYAGSGQISVSDPDFIKTEYFQALSEKLKDIRPAYKPYEMVEEEIDHYMNMPTFGSIYYDIYRDVYYRLGKLPKKGAYDPYRSDYLYPMSNPRDLVIIVLDSKFQKLTEYNISQPKDGAYFENCFVNEQGFHIAYVDYENEDELVFKQFILEQDNE
ncbi:DUF4221 family protein [Algoriphagus antarcticus]|uniref:Uncharacterized protein DUF4221 n=1 Tax=Algoriphagus antarcticus TaxID=238540 RepID=A0A3E0DBB4_9BACT|nr:DUF4221 family protein [Algoriphagus antarcticus]REG79375.1 uncharacterized protein DUF4221 [Algoriphagus antarcticus]